ncbi:MAG: hypothetical protein ACK5KR_08980 [Breznakia sp.]
MQKKETIKVRVIEEYYDKEQKKYAKVEDVFSVSDKRRDVLVKAGKVEIVQTEDKERNEVVNEAPKK